MGTDSRFRIFGDFNCPFCYALNERIHTLGLSDRVDWLSIEHMPEVLSKSFTFASLSELTSEVSEVRRLSPSTEICTPSFRPNSAFASSLVAEAGLRGAPKRAELRLQFYRALWIDGLDISDPEVVRDILQRCNLTGLEVSDEAKATQERWQKEWESEEYNRSLPIIITPGNETIIGIPGQPELDAILRGEDHNQEVKPGAVCVMGPQQRILALDSEAHHVHVLLEHMRNHHVIAVNSVAQVEQHMRAGDFPDLLLVNLDAVGFDGVAACQRAIQSANYEFEIPLVLIGDSAEETEVAAFEAGAADFIATPLHPKVLQARLNTQLDIIRSRMLLERMARLDGLTEVPNRREFDIRLTNEWERALRTGTTLSVMMIDADHFKAYNDGYGHARGDDCLRSLAQHLRESIHRPSDLLARYGGEEFAAVLPETGRQGALEVAERCMELIHEANIEHVHGGINDRVTVSIGLATAQPKRGGQALALLEVADQALYQAKQQGRNQLVQAD